MDTISLGIDLGSTGLRAAWAGSGPGPRVMPDGADQRPWTFRERDEPGRAAVFPSLKSKLGLVPDVVVNGSVLNPRDVLTQALASLRRRSAEESGAEVSQTVIAVPVSYQSAQRRALCECAQAAGLSCVRLISDSMAAVVAHARAGAGGTFLVYALGYRGFEAGLIHAAHGRFQTLGSAHAPAPGGATIDERLLRSWVGQSYPDGAPADWDDRTWENLRADAQAIRERWTGGARAHYPVFQPAGRLASPPPMAVEENYGEYLKQLTAATVSRAADVLRDASTAPADVDAVVLVGGCARMWPVRELIASLGRAVIATPDTQVATGAARYARLLDDPGAPFHREDLDTVDRPVGQPADLLAEARELAAAGQYAQAVAMAHRAWQEAKPEEAGIFEGMIDIHCTAAENTRDADFDSCERWLRCALSHHPGNERAGRLLTEISYVHAKALSDAGQRDGALRVLDGALPASASHGPSRDLGRRLRRSGTSWG